MTGSAYLETQKVKFTGQADIRQATGKPDCGNGLVELIENPPSGNGKFRQAMVRYQALKNADPPEGVA